MITLRPYQRSAIDDLYGWFHENPVGNPLLVLPTGSGKSIILATLIMEAVKNWPGTRVLVLTHVKELIAQDYNALMTIWPLAPAGIFSAGLKRRDVYDPIIFAGIQSVHDKAMHLGRFDLIIVDECHLISHEARGTYRKFLDDCRSINPDIRVVGLSATPFRTGHGSLMHGDDALFHGVAYQIGMLFLIEQGHLAPLTSKPTTTTIDVTGVATRQGEYAAGQLERACDQSAVTEAALDEVEALGADRKSWLIFCAGVAHAEHVTEALSARGYAVGCVTGKTKAVQRDNLIAQYKSGQLRALCNANVLTTGFDAPQTDLLVCLRPTQSPGLWVQLLGRGMRVAPGKTDCRVLDFAGNADRHGPVDQIEAWIPKPKTGGDAVFKTCPACQRQVATSVRFCECGYAFPFDDKPKHDEHASDAPLLSSDLAPRLETVTITDAHYYEHPGRDGRPSTLRVDYYDHFARVASEWICFNHSGYARNKAVAWWIKRAPGSLVPASVQDAHARRGELSLPTTITIDKRPKFPEITSYEFSNHPSNQSGTAYGTCQPDGHC